MCAEDDVEKFRQDIQEAHYKTLVHYLTRYLRVGARKRLRYAVYDTALKISGTGV